MRDGSNFGEILRRARKQARATQRDVATILGISAPYVSYVETGKRLPFDLDQIRELAAELDVDLYPLFAASMRVLGTGAVFGGATWHQLLVLARIVDRICELGEQQVQKLELSFKAISDE